MVVIKNTRENLETLYGDKFLQNVQDFSTVIGFTVEEEEDEIKVEFNPDRPDLFSFTSLMHSISTYSGDTRWKPLKLTSANDSFIVDQSARKLRPFAIGFQCDGAPIASHFRDMIDFQERIHLSIGKDRSKVSIGIHDRKHIKSPYTFKGLDAKIVHFTTYDGTITGTAADILSRHPKGIEYSRLIPSESMVPVIEDKSGQVLSMPPVVNGNVTTVTEDSRSFFIDITGTDQKAVRDAFFLLSYFFQDLGYRLSACNLGDIGDGLSFDGRIIKVPRESIKELIGMEIGFNEAASLLNRMGYEAKAIPGSIVVKVPGNRIDVMGPVDIIEDLAKAYDYQNILPQRPVLNLVGSEDPLKPFVGAIRGTMTGLGFQEIMSYVVTTRRHYENITYGGGVQVKNPKSLDFAVVRDRLIFGVLDFLRINKRRSLPQEVFEVGEVLIDALQYTHLCIAKSGSKAGYSEMKQVLDAFLGRFGINDHEVELTSNVSLIEGRSGSVAIREIAVGIIGEVKPETLYSFDLKNPVAIMELDVRALQSVINK